MPQLASTVHLALGPGLLAALALAPVLAQQPRQGPASISPPARLQLLAQIAVRDDLKLTDKQLHAIAELQKQWQSVFPSRAARGGEDARKAEETAREIENAIAEVLQHGQLRRLRQIELQLQLRDGREAAVFSLPAVVRDLKLTDEQLQKLKSIQEKHRKSMIPLFLTGDGYPEIEQKVARHKADTYDRLRNVLSEAQRAQLKEMIGEPFKGPVRPVPGGGARVRGTPASEQPIYLSTSGLLLTSAKALHDELKLSEAQVNRLVELGKKYRAENRQAGANPLGDPAAAEKRWKERAQAYDKAIAEMLEPEQLKRFRQIALQQVMRPNRYGSVNVARIVEVAEALKLTPVQKDQLDGGGQLAVVLNETQKAKWQEMLGKPFEADLFPPYPLPPVLQCLQAKSVQQELKLTDAQVKKLPAVEAKWQESYRAAMSTRGEESVQKEVAAAQALNADLAELLNRAQSDRLRQIELQYVGKPGLTRLLQYGRVPSDLALSFEDLERLRGIQREARKIDSLINREVASGQDTSPDLARTREQLRQLTEQQLKAILTEDQRRRLEEMLGEPFKGEILPRSAARSGRSSK